MNKAPYLRSRQSFALCCGSLLALVFLVFSTFSLIRANGFVNWDDHRNFLQNPFFRGVGWSQLKWAFTTDWLGVYQPLSWLLFGAQYAVFHLNPRGYHVVSLLLHAGNTVLLFFLTLEILRKAAREKATERVTEPVTWIGSAAVVALYMIHPLRAEPVAWASAQPYLTCSFFYLASVLAYLKQREKMSLVLFVAACLSKSFAVSLPVVLVMLDYFPLRRPGFYLREKSYFFLLAGLFCFASFFSAGESEPSRVFSLATLTFVLQKTLWPFGLSPHYPLNNEFDFISPAFVIAVCAIAWSNRRRWPGFAVSWGLYLVVMLPHIAAARLGQVLSADRYAYLGGAVWVPLTAWGTITLWRRIPFTSAKIFSCALVVVAFCYLATLSQAQSTSWRTSETLWSSALNGGGKRSAVAHNNLGETLQKAGKGDAAIAHYSAALQLDPDYAFAHNNLGFLLATRRQFPEAIAHLKEATRIWPGYAVAFSNLGFALTLQSKFEEALAPLSEAIRLDPNISGGHNTLGAALVGLGRVSEAARAFQEALRVDPTDRIARDNLKRVTGG